MPHSQAAIILQDLIRCRSITTEEGGALDYLEALLTQAGFQCQRLKFSDAETPDVDNLFARWGNGAPHLCFAGHSDVVPPGDEALWTHPAFGAEIHDGKIYGRGASDMKGSIAAFVTAALDYVGSSGAKPGSLSLLITGDEEGPARNGTVKVLRWMKELGHVPDHCLVGEPSCADKLGDTIKIGRRGSISFVITVDGTQGHVAYPQKADNPIPKLARFIDHVSGLHLDDGNDHFDASSLAVTSFDVDNPASNVIPARALAKFNIRYSPKQTASGLQALVQAQVDGVKAELGGVWTIKSTASADAFITEPGVFVGLVQDAIAEETGIVPKLSTSGGTSDARFVKDYCPVLEFGPTNASIHQTDEHITVEELDATSRVYARIIEKYFSA